MTTTKNIATFKKGVLLHASGVRTSQGALLFMGPSGAGKSTICTLLSDTFEPITDDVVHIAWREEIGWCVDEGRFYANEESIQANRKLKNYRKEKIAPIHAIFRIHQNKTPYISRLSQRELCSQIATGILEVAGQNMIYTCFKGLPWFRIASELARQKQGYNLHFTQEIDTVEAVSSFMV